MSRADNIAIFTDTMEACRTHPALKEAIAASLRAQEIVPEAAPLPAPALYPNDATVTVSGKRTLEAACAYAGQRVAVLNFASAVQPGGGVLLGSSAQEECLCRISTLYPCLTAPEAGEAFYAPHRLAQDVLHNDDCIHTPGVVVFKGDTEHPQALPEEQWFTVDVISCAAPNLREEPGNAMNAGEGESRSDLPAEELHALHVKRTRRICQLAAARGAEVLILGAFGCGAFRNDPAVVAGAMAQAIREYRRAFRTIEFAVYCPPGREENLHAFRSALEPLSIC